MLFKTIYDTQLREHYHVKTNDCYIDRYIVLLKISNHFIFKARDLFSCNIKTVKKYSQSFKIRCKSMLEIFTKIQPKN